MANLPTELLQQVANNLSIASAASFSFSCRHIHLMIGTQYLENLATWYHETLEFLELLEHDLQNQIVCKSCRKLHRIQDAREYTESYGGLLGAPDCLWDDEEAMAPFYINENFSTTVFKMAMKHYHPFGNDARSRQLLNLLSGKFRPYALGTLVIERKAECQIKSGSLFICKRIAFHGKCTGIERDSIFFPLCPHLEFKSIGRGRSASLCIQHRILFHFRRSGHCYYSTRTVLIERRHRGISARNFNHVNSVELNIRLVLSTMMVVLKISQSLSGRILGKGLKPKNGKHISLLKTRGHFHNLFNVMEER